MEQISGAVGPVILLLFVLVFFGMIFGIRSERVISVYLNLALKVLLIVGEVLTKIAVPLLRHLGEKIVYATNHYIAEHKAQKKQIAQDQPEAIGSQSPIVQMPQLQPKDEAKQKEPDVAKPSSANPYDDPPDPEIME